MEQLFCEAIANTATGEYGNLMCDVAELLKYVNERKRTTLRAAAAKLPETHVMVPVEVLNDHKRMVDALPHTADGVPILPGMTVYCVIGQHVDERSVIGPCGKLALYTDEPARHGAGRGQCHRLANAVYSARDNALRAAKDGK